MKSKQLIECLLCNEHANLIYENYPGYQEPDVFKLYHCSFCNTTFSMPRNDAKDIYELIYKNGKNVRWYDRYWRYAEAVKKERKPLDYLVESEVTYWAVKESLGQIIKEGNKSPKILEFGCGLGYLTYSLNEEGFVTKGLDISQEAIDQAIQNYGNNYICADLYEYALLHENEYDVIILTEVIEHLNEINTFMIYLKKLLKSNGKIILTTPNKSFYPKTILWATDLPPVHCWWLSEESIQTIATKLNMTATFLNFKKYYSKHVIWEEIKRIEIPFTPRVFDKNQRLIRPATQVISRVSIFKRIIKRIDIIRYLYASIRYSKLRSNPDLLLPGIKGPVLCAILQNNHKQNNED